MVIFLSTFTPSVYITLRVNVGHVIRLILPTVEHLILQASRAIADPLSITFRTINSKGEESRLSSSRTVVFGSRQAVQMVGQCSLVKDEYNIGTWPICLAGAIHHSRGGPTSAGTRCRLYKPYPILLIKLPPTAREHEPNTLLTLSDKFFV